MRRMSIQSRLNSTLWENMCYWPLICLWVVSLVKMVFIFAGTVFVLHFCQICILTPAYALNFTNHRFGSLFGLPRVPISLTFGPNDLGPYFWACRSLIVLPTVVLVIRTMPQTPPQTHTRTQPKTHPNTQTPSQTHPYSLKECLGFDTARHRAFPSKKRGRRHVGGTLIAGK